MKELAFVITISIPLTYILSRIFRYLYVMKTLQELLTEASINLDTVKTWIERGKMISIYYAGDDNLKKGWSTISPSKIEKVNGKDYLLATDMGGSSNEQVYVDIELIKNVNVLSNVKSSILDDIASSIVNKRMVILVYQGARENSPGKRFRVMPVCYGIGKKGRKYIRAWQEGGKTVTGVPAWKLFRFDRIRSWEIQGNLTFDCGDVGPSLNQEGDKAMTRIIAIIDCAPQKTAKPKPTAPKKPSAKKNDTSDKKATKTAPTSSTTAASSTGKPAQPEAPKKAVKGPARPGAAKPERDKKGPARPGALKESTIIGAVVDAVKIL